MKKILLSAVATILMAGTAMAEGYQINSLSTKQIGMGHTGVALKLGAENMYFNPAGMAYMDKTLDLTGSFTGIMPTATATVDGKEYETDNGVSTPISVNAAFSIYPNLKGGIAFYTPYGSSINWTDNWPGSVLNQNVSLKAFTIQPTLAWAINDKFSIGLGAMVTWATVDLNKGLVSASTADNVINAMKTLGQLPASVGSFGSTTPASVNLNGKTRIAVGFNIGAMYNVNDRLTFGASFRSKMDMKVKAGEAHVSYANELAQTLTGETIDLINNANFKAQMPCPWVLSLGASYKPVDRLTLAFDARLTGWHAYKSLDVEFLDEQLVQKGLNQYIPKHYKNSWCFSLGAQYALTERFDLRAGLMVDTSPVDKNYYNPETPGMTKI
ncbi:OmpP1/FadL family transporter, partial [uncultured Duncaniella sp.]